MKFYSLAVIGFLMMLCIVNAKGSESIYQIPFQWTDETNTKVNLSQYKDYFIIMTMTYTSCQSACPLILKKLRKIDQEMDHEPNVQFVIVTFDPSVDTVKILAQHKKANKIDTSRWHFLNGSEEDTRKLSLLLDISYQKNPDTGHFMHDNKLILLDKTGHILSTLDGLNSETDPFLKAMGKTRKMTLFEKIKAFFRGRS